MLIRNAEVWGFGPADVRIEDARVSALRPAGSLLGKQRVIEANGGLLLPGLHDHHIHLAALAAKRASIWSGPPEVTTPEQLAAALNIPGGGWIRGIGYHDSVMGLPTARELDRLVAHRPLRIQHRSGRLWLLNSLALERLLERGPAPPGLDRSTGHLFDEDAWLRAALASSPPSFAEVSRELAKFGVTGVTDMSPANDAAMAEHFAAEMTSGALSQRVALAGKLELAQAAAGPWRLGPAKLHLHESALPDFADASAFIAAAHAQDRPVAVHCVSEVELVFALAAIEAAGARPGDRIEHASVASDELVARVAELGLQVCVQPNFVAERGEEYLRDVEPRHVPELYRVRSFAEAGVTLAGGSDAPFGSPDPWASMAAAISRSTLAGAVIGRDEALSPEQALELHLTDPLDLTQERRIEPGAPADLCLLHRGWSQSRCELNAALVRATWISGRLVHDGVDQPPIESGARADPLT